MFNDQELEDLYIKLDKLCTPSARTVEPQLNIKQTLSSNQLINNSSSVDELERMINDLDNEENLGKMNKHDLFLNIHKISTGNANDDEGEAPAVNTHSRFIGKPVAADGVFSNIKRDIRQSAKKRIEAYANTSAKLVKESNMEPLKLEQYTEK
jgi:hypothetical protein